MCAQLFVLLVVVSSVQALTPYHGKLIHSGWGAIVDHGLTGDTYAVNENTIQIIGFSYDGNPPGGVFLLGTDKKYSAVTGAATRDPTATIIANPDGNFQALGRYDNENITLRLPPGQVLTDYTYISVWCRNFTVYFGGFDIPEGFVSPKPQNIGPLTHRAHAVYSGDVTIIDDKTISILNLRYDGQGPDAFFYVGVTDLVTTQVAPYGKIPDENGDSGVISGYAGKNITITLPDNLSFTQLKWFSLYCILFTQNFGEVFIPENLNVPPALDVAAASTTAGVTTTTMAAPVMNCEPLSNKLQISWAVEDNSIAFELAGTIDRETDYMAFGLSGSDSTFQMRNADVVVGYWKSGETAKAVDYYITSYAQCAPNGGACPDTSVSNGGANDVTNIEGQFSEGVLRIKYKRSLTTGDSRDKEYKISGPGQHIVWAIGPLNSNDETAKHYPSAGRISIAKTIQFGRDMVNNCPELAVKTTVAPIPDFKPHHLYGTEDLTVFTLEIGQAGSTQGYLALTGIQSWGIAWYVNGILIPELHLKRGVSYTFRVGGGTDSNNGARYHPLYFTNDIKGGFLQTQGSTETIYEGTVDGVSQQYATGGYCEWKLTEAAVQATLSGKVYQTFEEFKQDMYLDCDNSSQYTNFIFTPDSNTPDLIYYQCYTHKSLGWKVHVYDELPTESPSSTTQAGSSASGIDSTSKQSRFKGSSAHSINQSKLAKYIIFLIAITSITLF